MKNTVRGILLGAVLATGVSLVGSAPASAYWVCPPTSATTYAPDGAAGSRCHGTYNGALSYVQKKTPGPHHSYAVYRASCSGCAGTDYYAGTSEYLKDFGCAAGYPGGHNRHSVTIAVDYTLAGSC